MGHGEAVLGVTACTDGALGGDTDLSIGGACGVTGNPGVVGLGLLGSAAGWMNLLFLMHQAPKLMWTW